MKLLIAIPAYNEESTIRKVIKSIPPKIKDIKKIETIIIDDGSEDNTGKVAEKYGAIVLRHLINRGLGGAIATALEYAKINNYDLLITLDADGQHEPKDIPIFINSIRVNKNDVVIGSRWLNGSDAPLSRIFINKIANFLTFFLCGVFSTDSQSGYRAFSKNAIQKVNLHTSGMEVSSEIFSEIYKNKLKYGEVPIKAIYTKYSKAKGQRLSDAPDVLIRLIIRILS